MFAKQSASAYLAELILMTALTAAACFAPFVSLLCMVLLPVFFAMLTACRSFKCITLYTIVHVSLIVVFFFVQNGISITTTADAALFALLLSLCGIAIGACMRRTHSLYQIVGAGTGAVLLVVLLQIGKLRWLDGIDFMETFVEQPTSNMAAIYQSLYGPSVLSQDVIWLLQQAVGAIIPACLLIFSLYLAYFVFLLSRKLLYCWCHMVYPNIAHFWEIQCRRYVSISFAVALLLSNLLGMSQTGNAALNLAMILGSAIMLCGFSVIDYYFRKTRLACGLRALIYVIGFIALNFLTLIIPLFHTMTILIMIGLLDSFFNFRKLQQKEADVQ